MIYDMYGNALQAAFDKNGAALNQTFDINGTPMVGTLKVMTYNVLRWEGDNALVSIQDVAFGNVGADIVGIQEWGYTESKNIDGVSCTAYLGNHGYDYIAVTSGDVNHKAVASKIPMTGMTEVVYTQSIETRSYTKSYFTFGGKTIAFFNTHTDYQLNSSVKFAQIQELLDAVSEEDYFILTGDLNTTCTSKAETEYLSCVQPFVDAGYNVANSPANQELIWTFYNGKTPTASTQITPPDNIITSANISILSTYTVDTKLEEDTSNVIDHLPLVCVLAIN